MENLKIGLPQSMLYFRYEALWKAYFEALGAEVICSGTTTKRMLDRGGELCVDEACLAAKLFLGHVDSLIGKCDYVLVPRVSNFGHRRNMCSRFEAMPDVVKNVFRDVPQKFLTYNLDVGRKLDEETAFFGMGQQLGFDKKTLKKAYSAAHKADVRAYKEQLAAQEDLFKADGIKLLIAAHSYIIEDPYLGRPVMDILRDMGVTPIRADIVERDAALKRSLTISPTVKWEVNREILGGISMYRDKVDGMVLLSAFPCGPDSMVNEVITHNVKDMPVLTLTLDAQSGTAGVETRLESFVDIIRFKEGTL